MTILGVIPFAATLAWALIFYFRCDSGARSWRWSLALACLLLATFTLLLTEALSAWHLVAITPGVIAWGIYVMIPAVLVTAGRKRVDWKAEYWRLACKVKGAPLWMVVAIGGLFFLIFRMATASPPCNYDVQSYHLPRQIYWLMQGSVEHYSATYSYQNLHPVLTEFLGLNLMLLSGGDAWHNLVQCLFFVAACGLVTLITQSIGGGNRAQALAILFIALVPVVFFEASNSKNDVAASFFLMVPLLIGLKIWNLQWRAGVPLLLLASLAAGLAMATKGTSAAYLPASALLIVIACLRAREWKVLLLAILPGLLIALLPMAPNSIRNIQSYHSLSGEAASLLNSAHDPVSVVGVVIKNLANQFAFGSDHSIQSLEKATRSLLVKISLDPDDPNTNGAFEQLHGTNLHFFYTIGCEDVIPAPVQTALVLLLLPLLLMMPSLRKGSGTLPLACVMIGSFLLFSAIFRWQPWGGRLLIPAFFMAAPLIGKAEDLLRPRWIPVLLIALEAMFLWQHISHTGQRHLMGWSSVFRMPKEDQMSMAFMGRKEEIRSVIETLRAKNVSQIQVDGKDSPIYGLLREIRISLPEAQIMSGHLSTPSQADVLIEALGSTAATTPRQIAGYEVIWSGAFYRVYCR